MLSYLENRSDQNDTEAPTGWNGQLRLPIGGNLPIFFHEAGIIYTTVCNGLPLHNAAREPTKKTTVWLQMQMQVVTPTNENNKSKQP